MSDNNIRFSLSGILQTNDGYRLKLEGVVISSREIDKLKLNSLLSNVCISYFRNKSLTESLNIVEKGEYEDLKDLVIEGSKSNGLDVSFFKILTIDANFQHEDESLELDPNLELGKKKKGFLGKIFGKS